MKKEKCAHTHIHCHKTKWVVRIGWAVLCWLLGAMQIIVLSSISFGMVQFIAHIIHIL